MKCVILGLGSMGKRRGRLLLARKDVTAVCGVDFSPQRREEAAGQLGIPCFASLEEAITAISPQAAFICTPPATHCPIIRQALENGLHVFTELNLIDRGYDSLISLARERGLRLFISSTLLYRKEIRHILSLTKDKGPFTYLYHVGQYLPDWHPWESYQDFFVGKKETNGCREILAIQLPWIFRAFGEEASLVSAAAGRLTRLNIDYPDSYLITLTHRGGNRGMLAVDVVSRKSMCSLEIIGEQLHLWWDGTPDGLRCYNLETRQVESVRLYEHFEQDARYAANIIEDAYDAEIEAFFQYCQHAVQPIYMLEDDQKTLQLIGRIEEEALCSR